MERKDDIPGFLAPMIYFDFVDRQNPEGMFGIIRHNEIDILSLITLYTHLSFQLLRLDQSQTAKESYEVGRWFSALGETAVATEAFTELSKGKSEEAAKAKHALAFEHKRRKDWENARLLWEDIAETGKAAVQIEASVELAKLYEHREKNYEKALKYCKKAKQVHEHMMRTSRGESGKIGLDLQKRSDRLIRRISRQP